MMSLRRSNNTHVSRALAKASYGAPRYPPGRIRRRAPMCYSQILPALRVGYMGEILIDGGQFVIIHFSDRTPRHLFADLMTVWIDASTHGCGEAGQRPVLDQIQVGSERWQLPGH